MRKDLCKYLKLRNTEWEEVKKFVNSKFFTESSVDPLNRLNYSEEIIKQSFELLKNDKIDYSKLISKN